MPNSPLIPPDNAAVTSDDVVDRLLGTNLTLRRRLFIGMAANRSLALLSLLGLLVGSMVGLTMVGFEALIAWSHTIIADGSGMRPDDFSNIPSLHRLLIPIGGSLFIALVLYRSKARERFSGIAHVIHQLSQHDSMLPLRSAVLQFWGACMALASGMSVGREGPAIHISAAIAGIGGRKGYLPANTTRILVACGAAAAVAASFNTPLAGVILAMEVILMEYSIAGFAPIILSAVAATATAQIFHGTVPTFVVPEIQLESLLEIPWLVFVGVVLGCLSRGLGLFIEKISAAVSSWSLYSRFLTAGIICGGIGYFVPEVMGVGYSTVDKALIGEYTLMASLMIMALKLVASSATIALGVPGGIIGPTIVIGAMAGTTLGYIGQSFGIDNISSIAFYTLLGMGAMMGATLHAPLAALTALLELTSNPNLILPGMLVVIVAYLTNRIFLKGQPLFLRILELQGEPWVPDPRVQAMQQTAVATVLDDDAISIKPSISIKQLTELASQYRSIVVPENNSLYSSQDILTWQSEFAPQYDCDVSVEMAQLDIRNQHCMAITAGSSLHSAHVKLSRGETQSFFVIWPSDRKNPNNAKILGVLGDDAVRGYVKLDYCRL